MSLSVLFDTKSLSIWQIVLCGRKIADGKTKAIGQRKTSREKKIAERYMHTFTIDKD